MDAFQELLARVRETASLVARVVQAIRHAHLLPPSLTALGPAGPGGTSEDSSAVSALSTGVTPTGRDAGGEASQAGGQSISGRTKNAQAAVPEMQEFADHVERHCSQATPLADRGQRDYLAATHSVKHCHPEGGLKLEQTQLSDACPPGGHCVSC